VIGGRALESNSGLRPASAFLLVGVVFAAVAAAVAGTAFGVDDSVRRWEQDEQDPSPAYTITDRDERPVALFVQRLDLVLSPNAMWQAHTPERVATELASVLGCNVNELAMAMMPDATGGVIRTSMPLDTPTAARIQAWIQSGTPDASEPLRDPIQGMWIGRDERGAYVLCWQPFAVLSATQRAQHGNDYGEKPRKWARHIADGLALCMMGEYAVKPGEDELALEEQRSAVWSWLMPTTYTVAVRGFDASRAPKLIEVLSREKVAHHQMRVERGRDREYPAGRFPFLGLWGYVDEPVARRAADRALELVAEGTPSATANAALVDESQELAALVTALGAVQDEGEYRARLRPAASAARGPASAARDRRHVRARRPRPRVRRRDRASRAVRPRQPPAAAPRRGRRGDAGAPARKGRRAPRGLRAAVPRRPAAVPPHAVVALRRARGVPVARRAHRRGRGALAQPLPRRRGGRREAGGPSDPQRRASRTDAFALIPRYCLTYPRIPARVRRRTPPRASRRRPMRGRSPHRARQ